MTEDFQAFLEDMLVYLSCQEAGLVQLRMQINKILGETKPSTKLPFNAEKIRWQDKENENGKFQVSEDYNSLDHKALLKFLNSHAGGCMTSEGLFYWVYRAGDRIGRKPSDQCRKKGGS